MQIKNIMKNIFKITCIIIIYSILFPVYGMSTPSYSGIYMFTYSGNDNDLTEVNNLINDWLNLNNEENIKIEYVSKLENEGSNNDFKFFFNDTKKEGTFSSLNNINFYSVKGGNQFAVYWLDISMLNLSNYMWSTEHLINGGGNQPDLSHISIFWTDEKNLPVPESLTILLFGFGLLFITGISRKFNTFK